MSLREYRVKPCNITRKMNNHSNDLYMRCSRRASRALQRDSILLPAFPTTAPRSTTLCRSSARLANRFPQYLSELAACAGAARPSIRVLSRRNQIKVVHGTALEAEICQSPARAVPQ